MSFNLFTMKYIITEQQLEKIKENILKLPFTAFDYDWDLLQKYLERKNFPPYILVGDLDYADNGNVQSLGSLIGVTGYLDLYRTPIKSLGNLTFVGENLYLTNSNIESLGNLTSVGWSLRLTSTPIKSLGNLNYVGKNLHLIDTPISRTHTEEQIRDMVEVGGNIYTEKY